MRSLRDVQMEFAAALDGADDHAAMLTSARRLNVYRNNIRTTLTETLGAIYPVVRRLVGDDFFKYCAREFIREYPSRSGNLNDFGSSFATFILTFKPARELGYLPDVARLDWSYHVAFHAADHAPMRPERLAALPAEHHEAVCFRLHPSAQLLASQFPILKIWKANQDGADPGETISLDEPGDVLLVIRPALDVEFIRLGPGAYRMLQSICGGDTFGAACAAALDADPEFQLEEFFAFCVTHGVIVDFTLSETTP